MLAGFVFVFVLIMSGRRHSLYERRLLSLGNEWHVSSCWLRSTWIDLGLPLDIPRTRDQPADPDGSPGGAAGHAALPAALDEQH